MPTTRQCAECGTPLPDDVPEGACPVCALRGALDLPEDTTEVAVTEKPGDRIGRYKLLEKIGEGGCGIVYLAEQAEPICRRVALKVIRLGMDTRQAVARFEAERQALALMDHPNIARVLDAGATDTGRSYFVMELVRGIRITASCVTSCRVAPALVLRSRTAEGGLHCSITPLFHSPQDSLQPFPPFSSVYYGVI